MLNIKSRLGVWQIIKGWGKETCLVHEQRRSEAYADIYRTLSTDVYIMMSWLDEEPMVEHVAVEFWSDSTCPEKL